MPRTLRQNLTFIALAVLFGPIASFVVPQWSAPMRWQIFAGEALVSFVAGGVLVVASVVRREPALHRDQRIALIILLAPQVLNTLLSPPYVRQFAWLHETPWGIAFLLDLAAPLWLALLAALELVPIVVPRVAAGAGIAGLGAACLVLPVDSYRVLGNQLAVLLLHLALSVATVYSWSYARSRLTRAGTLAAAGSFLLLQASSQAALSLLFERSHWSPADWREAAIPLLLGASATVASFGLWFWLLCNLRLPVFSMIPLATWIAGTLPGFLMFGFMSWRIDLALVISLVAVVVAFRSAGGEEQLMALGLEHG